MACSRLFQRSCVSDSLPPPPPSAVPLPRSSAAREDLRGKHIVVTAGPTHEPIDPVRVIANRSSGRQGFAIAAAAAEAGSRVTLVAGPVALETPPGVDRIDVETAEQMADAVFAALPADAAILVAAVADWRAVTSPSRRPNRAGPPRRALCPALDMLPSPVRTARRPPPRCRFSAG